MVYIRFDSEGDWAWWVPSREWAGAWAKGAVAHWTLVVGDYRSRVRDYYNTKFVVSPATFPLMSPTSLSIVVCFYGFWVFAETSSSDLVTVYELWEHPDISHSEFRHAPNQEEQVRSSAGISEGADLIWSEPRVINALDSKKHKDFDDPFVNARIPELTMPGWIIADADSRESEFFEVMSELMDRQLDVFALSALGEELKTLRNMKRKQARGLSFEAFIERLFLAYGCEVERGKHREGEQIDLFVHRPFRALVECRWQAKPVGVPAVTGLVAKLTRDRPSIVSGIYISMSGFTSTAVKEAADHARDRVVILFDQDDVLDLIKGETHVADLFESRLDSLVRRY